MVCIKCIIYSSRTGLRQLFPHPASNELRYDHKHHESTERRQDGAGAEHNARVICAKDSGVRDTDGFGTVVEHSAALFCDLGRHLITICENHKLLKLRYF